MHVWTFSHYLVAIRVNSDSGFLISAEFGGEDKHAMAAEKRALGERDAILRAAMKEFDAKVEVLYSNAQTKLKLDSHIAPGIVNALPIWHHRLTT